MKPNALAASIAKAYGRMMLLPAHSSLVYFLAGGPMCSVRWK